MLYMFCAKELGYSKFILHKQINIPLQQGLASTRNSEGENVKDEKNNEGENTRTITFVLKRQLKIMFMSIFLHLPFTDFIYLFFFTPQYYLQFSQINFSYFVRRYLPVFVLY